MQMVRTTRHDGNDGVKHGCFSNVDAAITAPLGSALHGMRSPPSRHPGGRVARIGHGVDEGDQGFRRRLGFNAIRRFVIREAIRTDRCDTFLVC